MELAPGSMFAGYRIVALLGQSPTGPVYLVDNPENGDREELHIVSSARGAGLDLRGRIVDDASATATYSSPHLAELRRGVQDGTPWFTIPDTGAAIPAQQLPPTPQPPASPDATVHVALPPKGRAPHQPPPQQPAPPQPAQGPPPRRGHPGGAPGGPAGPPPPGAGPQQGPRRGPTPPPGGPPPGHDPRHRPHDHEPTAPEPAAPRSRGNLIVGAVSALVLVAIIIGAIVYFVNRDGDSTPADRADTTTGRTDGAPETTKGPGHATVATNGGTSCAIQDAALYCWNESASGIIRDEGEPRPTRDAGPILIRDNADVTAVSISTGSGTGATGHQICAVGDLRVYCMGQDGDLKQVPGLTDVTALSTGTQAACAIAAGAPHCWTLGDDPAPQKVEGVHGTPTGLAMSGNNACAISDATLYCWDTTETEAGLTAKANPDVDGVTDVALLGDSMCVIAWDSVECGNREGEDGLNIINDINNPHSLALSANRGWAVTDGTLKYWENGGLPKPAENAKPELTGVTALSTGPGRVCAIADTKVYCWAAGATETGQPISLG